MLSSGLLLSGLLGLGLAQFPPTPEGIKVLKSKFQENVTISFKNPGICETTPGVRSYAGYIHLPPGLLDDGSGEVQDYPINTFFWFFEARKDPVHAPLSIWLNGGPGASSMMGLLEENGPCMVAADSATTVPNPWSWNNEVNMLYIDQPTQVGFSYDVPTNATLVRSGAPGTEDEFETRPADFSGGVPEANITHRYGTFASQNRSRTAKTTEQAAHALWHFAQTWFFEFPHYKPADNSVSLWAESYGGHYGPGVLRFFQRQNELVANGTPTERTAHPLRVDTLGIVNGHIDLVIQGESSITWPYNNTYGLQLFNQSLYDDLMWNWTKPDGCKERFAACQDELKNYEPVRLSQLSGRNDLKACKRLEGVCEYGAAETYMASGVGGWFDIAHPKADPFPAPHLYGYLTRAPVLAPLGVPVNFSSISSAVGYQFDKSLDIVHGGSLDAIGYLLDAGVKVHMMYGDRDMACNWVGGEAASLAVRHRHAAAFARAGYEPLVLTDGGVGGMTRQHGNFSFTRVFQAGHEVPAYQPEAAYAIFRRAMFNRDVPTGRIPVTDDFATSGPRDVWHIKNTPPARPAPRCYVLKPETCLPEVWERAAKGLAVVKDFFVVDDSAAEAAVGEMGEL